MATIPANGATVNAWKDGVIVATDTCDSSGNYTLAVPDGTYNVMVVDYPCACDDPVNCPDGCTHIGDSQSVTVTNGQELTGINFILEPV